MLKSLSNLVVPAIQAARDAEKLRESEEKYRGIFDESVAAVYVFDAQKKFLDSNQAGLDLLGYTREELLSMSIPDVDAEPDVVLPAHAEAIRRALLDAETPMEIRVADSLSELREAVAVRSPDLVLLDLLLPDGRADAALVSPKVRSRSSADRGESGEGACEANPFCCRAASTSGRTSDG